MKNVSEYWRKVADRIGSIHGMCTIVLLIEMLAIPASKAYAQQPDYYITVDGAIMIQGKYNDTPLKAMSKKVTVLIDYNTGDFTLYFDASTLKTGELALDTLLAKRKGYVIQYEGKFGVDHVKTESHPPLDFVVEGYINCHYHNNFIQGRGRLEHLYDDHYSCMLDMSFDLTLDQLPFNIDVEGLDENIKIVIVQMVMNQNSSSNHSNY